MRQAIFVGFFGPIGCSAIFYLYITLEFVESLQEKERDDVHDLSEATHVVVWFLVISSVVRPSTQLAPEYTKFPLKVVHGLSIPLGKFGYYLPRTISRTATAQNSESEPPSRINALVGGTFSPGASRAPTRRNSLDPPASTPTRETYRIGGSIIPAQDPPAILLNTEMPSRASKSAEASDDSTHNFGLDRIIRFQERPQPKANFSATSNGN